MEIKSIDIRHHVGNFADCEKCVICFGWRKYSHCTEPTFL